MSSVSLLQTGSVLLLNSSFSWLVGSCFARLWLKSGGAEPTEAGETLRRSDGMAAGLCLFSSAAGLWAATAVMGGVGLSDVPSMLWMMLSSTDYGRAGCVTVLAMLIIFWLRMRVGFSRVTEISMALLLAVFAVTRASMGHAGENGFWSVSLAAETVHLLGISVWTGAVAVSGWKVLSKSETRNGQIDTASYLELMSTAALISVVAIFATGLYNAWHRVGRPEHLLHTEYGTTLLIKVGLVVVAVVLGGYNKFYGLPAAARSPGGLQRVTSVLRIETVVLFGALTAAAILTSQQPPMSM